MTEEIRTDNTDVIANACKKITELEEENEKLKKINSETISELNHINGDLIIKLAQAKEIIKEWLRWANDDVESSGFQEIVNKAEQFLKEK